MRLDAQIKLSEEKAKPKWPLVVVPVLFLGIIGAGVMWYRSNSAAEQEAAEKAKAEELAAKQAEALEAITAKLDALEAEQARMEKERTDLQAQIEAAKGDESKRKELEAKLKSLDAKIAENEAEQEQASSKSGKARKPRKKKSGSSSSSSSSSSSPVKPKSTGRKEKLGLNDGDDPLGGL